jgi:L-alanine-DL-glutamate epimerase-like enolase superfamily enzyme
MKLVFKPYLLEFKHPFGVSSNTRTHTQSVFTRISYNGVFGYGEACLPVYLGETLEETILFLEKAEKIIEKYKSPIEAEELFKEIDEILTGCNAAKAAIDIALCDLRGKIENKPFYNILKIGKSEANITACTIGIDDEKTIALKIEEAKEFSVLKIKAGTKDDKALINLIRKYTDKPLYVDVNQGWTDKYFVVDMVAWLKEKGVLLIEQPMPVNMIDEMAWVTERSALPTFADESAKRFNDIDNIKGVFSGINIKLMKSAGLTEAHKMINYAKQNQLKIFLGCMAESSCATSAMAQLMQFADFIDLDAPMLIKNDPFKGITYKNGKVNLNDLAGIGVELDESLLRF